MESRLRRSTTTLVFAALFVVWLLRCLRTFVMAVLRDDRDATMPEPPSGGPRHRSGGGASRAA